MKTIHNSFYYGKTSVSLLYIYNSASFSTNLPFIKKKDVLHTFTSKYNLLQVKFISQIYCTSSKFSKFELNL